MGGGFKAGKPKGNKASRALREHASDERAWASWSDIRAAEERGKGNSFGAAVWEARGAEARVEAAAADAAADAIDAAAKAADKL